MPKATLSLFLLALAALLAGCANFAPFRAGRLRSRSRRSWARPKTVRKNRTARSVGVSGGPFGRQTYMVTLGSDRAVREIHQVLSDEYFARVRVGMSRDEVRRLLGQAGETMVFGARDEEVWSWRYQDQNPMFFNVLFDGPPGRSGRPAARGNPLPGPEYVKGSRVMNATFSRAVLLLVSVLFAAGCAGFSAINPGASAQQVETLVGPPANVWRNADGSEVWEYPQGPLGVETYMGGAGTRPRGA